jgi:hypothetical protein
VKDLNLTRIIQNHINQRIKTKRNKQWVLSKKKAGPWSPVLPPESAKSFAINWPRWPWRTRKQAHLVQCMG